MTTRGERRERAYTTRGELSGRATTSPARRHYRTIKAAYPPPAAENLKEEVAILRRAVAALAEEVENIVNEIGVFIDKEGRIEEVSPALRKWMDARYI